MNQGRYIETLAIILKQCFISVYIICAGQHSFAAPTFMNVTYSPILLISNIDVTVTTANVPRLVYLENQK
jgi:hypothetical protein